MKNMKNMKNMKIMKALVFSFILRKVEIWWFKNLEEEAH
jgi:hypothetical protein